MTDGAPRREPDCGRVRLDRWLWAARFFKTRALAKAAIEGGRVLVLPAGGSAQQAERPDGRGVKPKPGREIGPGDRLLIRRIESIQTVVVRAVAERRGTATVASRLFEETLESLEARETARARRQLERAGLQVPAARPDKRERRERLRFKHGDADEEASADDEAAEPAGATPAGTTDPGEARH